MTGGARLVLIGPARCGTVRSGLAGEVSRALGKVSRALDGRGMVWQGWFGSVWTGMVRSGAVGFSKAGADRRGVDGFGLVWLAGYVAAWC